MMFDTCLSTEMRMRERMVGGSEDQDDLKGYLQGLDPNLAKVFLRWTLRHPRYLRAVPRLIRSHKRCRRLRERALKDGTLVPPFLILSITSRCNLRCSGCYAAATGTKDERRGHLEIEEWRRIIEEACSIGVFSFIIAGGEPFMVPGLVELCREFEDRIFIVLTNGTTMRWSDLRALKGSRNIFVVVSLEGDNELTDARRGPGVHDKVLETMKGLHKVGVPFGVSVTITRMNNSYWMDPGNIDDLISKGALVGVFIEYIPVKGQGRCTPVFDPAPIGWGLEDDSSLVLTPEQRSRLRSRILEYRSNRRFYLIHSPGDEDLFGGCVSAGRGFAHVTPTGDLTPCPISNIATHNLARDHLMDALASPLFQRIREDEHLLEKGDSPCALISHPEEVDALAREVGAYRTDEV